MAGSASAKFGDHVVGGLVLDGQLGRGVIAQRDDGVFDASLKARGGAVGTLKVDEGTVVITDLDKRDQDAVIDLRVTGPTLDALKLAHTRIVAFHERQKPQDQRFTDALGLSPRDYWMKCRIRAACESIIKGEEKLGALSMRLGFCDQSSFTAQFRRHTGVTPSAFARGKKALN